MIKTGNKQCTRSYNTSKKFSRNLICCFWESVLFGRVFVGRFNMYKLFIMKNIVILENIRSAYNVGNIIRTADALGYDVVLSGFSPSPFDDEKVRKTSLGAEEYVGIQQFWNPLEALKTLKEK